MHSDPARRLLWNTIALLLPARLAAPPLAAQFNTASLGGTVRDSTGSVVPDAKVTVRNLATGLSRERTTSGDGAYSHPGLPVGAYRVTVEKAGFATYVQEGLTLTVGQAASQNVTLQVGAMAQEVTVRENSVMVNAGIHKEFSLVERVRLLVQFPVTNAFNHANYSNPAANISSPARVGTIMGAAAARAGQIAARIEF